jgi:hypothetical protein
MWIENTKAPSILKRLNVVKISTALYTHHLNENVMKDEVKLSPNSIKQTQSFVG